MNEIFARLNERTHRNRLFVPDLYNYPTLTKDQAIMVGLLLRSETVAFERRCQGQLGMDDDGFFILTDDYLKNSGWFTDSNQIYYVLKTLRDLDICETKRKGVPARRWVRMHLSNLDLLEKSNIQSLQGKNPDNIGNLSKNIQSLDTPNIQSLYKRNKYNTSLHEDSVLGQNESATLFQMDGINGPLWELLLKMTKVGKFKTRLPSNPNGKQTSKLKQIIKHLQLIKDGRFGRTIEWDSDWLQGKDLDLLKGPYNTWNDLFEKLLKGPLEQNAESSRTTDMEEFLATPFIPSENGPRKSKSILIEFLNGTKKVPHGKKAPNQVKSKIPEQCRALFQDLIDTADERQIKSISSGDWWFWWKACQDWVLWYSENTELLQKQNLDKNQHRIGTAYDFVKLGIDLLKESVRGFPVYMPSPLSGSDLWDAMVERATLSDINVDLAPSLEKANKVAEQKKSDSEQFYRNTYLSKLSKSSAKSTDKAKATALMDVADEFTPAKPAIEWVLNELSLLDQSDDSVLNAIEYVLDLK